MHRRCDHGCQFARNKPACCSTRWYKRHCSFPLNYTSCHLCCWENTSSVTVPTFATNILTAFPGEQKKDPKKDSYNFFFSQLQIQIEMTFEHLVNIWKIPKQPLQVKLMNSGRVFMCSMRLHKFCINKGGTDE